MTGQARREQVTAARRVVVKVGSSSLTTGRRRHRPRARAPARRRARRRARPAAPRSSWSRPVRSPPASRRSGWPAVRAPSRRSRPRPPSGRACSCTATPRSSPRHGLVAGQVLLTADDVTRRSHYRNAHQTFAKLLELGVLPIVNENDTVATGEIRFGDNDRLAALVAHLVHADLLVLLSDVDGLYDGHPAAEGSRLITDVASGRRPGGRARGRAGAAGVGTGGMRTKLEAARIATGAGIPVVLTSAEQAGDALAARAGRHVVPGRRPGAGPPGCCGWPTPPSPRACCCSTTGPSARSPSAAASLLAAGLTGATGVVRRRRPGRPGRSRRPGGRPRPGQLRRRRDPAAGREDLRRPCGASSGRRTSARSCTATTSPSSDPRAPGRPPDDDLEGPGRTTRVLRARRCGENGVVCAGWVHDDPSPSPRPGRLRHHRCLPGRLRAGPGLLPHGRRAVCRPGTRSPPRRSRTACPPAAPWSAARCTTGRSRWWSRPPGVTVAGDGYGTHGEVVGLRVTNTGTEVRATTGAPAGATSAATTTTDRRADPAACKDRTFHLEGHHWKTVAALRHQPRARLRRSSARRP